MKEKDNIDRVRSELAALRYAAAEIKKLIRRKKKELQNVCAHTRVSRSGRNVLGGEMCKCLDCGIEEGTDPRCAIVGSDKFRKLTVTNSSEE